MATPEITLTNPTIGKWVMEDGIPVAKDLITFTGPMVLVCHRDDGNLFNGRYSYVDQHVTIEVQLFHKIRSGELELSLVKLEFAPGYQSQEESGYSLVSVTPVAQTGDAANVLPQLQITPLASWAVGSVKIEAV
jgi:hypothetical protein